MQRFRRALRGYAIAFGARSANLGGFVEIIKSSAVDRMLAERTDLRALWNHNAEIAIGRVKAGPLKVSKDSTGLHVRIATPKWARGHVESVERRDVTGMSFAFAARDDAWSLDDGVPVREVFDMSVSEVSPVSFPAYPATTLSTGAEGTGRSIELARRCYWPNSVRYDTQKPAATRPCSMCGRVSRLIEERRVTPESEHRMLYEPSRARRRAFFPLAPC